MKKNRIHAYWLFLLVLLYAAGTVLSVGEAQARYVTTATWNTVVAQQEESKVTSDCLEDISGAPLTILLGTMPQDSYPVTFTLTAEEATSGILKWEVNSEYISVKMCIDNTEIDSGTDIEIDAGDTVVTMILTPTETAFTEAREAISASVAVTWADTLKGTFLTQLPAVEKEDDTTEDEEDGANDGEGDGSIGGEGDGSIGGEGDGSIGGEGDGSIGGEGDGSNGGEGDGSIGGEGDGSNDGEKENPTVEPDPTEATQPEPGTGTAGLTTHNETSEDETVPEEETEPITTDEPDGQAEEGDDPSNPETPGEGNDDSDDSSESSEGTTEEPTEPVQEESPTMTIQLETASAVNPAEALPIRIKAPQNGGAVRLGIATVTESEDPEGEPQTGLSGFPKYTRYSLSDGASCYMLYTENTIALDVADGGTISVLLDLSRVDLSGVELEQFQVILGAAPHSAEGEIATCSTTVIPESVRYASVSSRVLTDGTPLEIQVSDYWKDYSLTYSLEMLIEDPETKIMGYKSVVLPENCLIAEVVSDEAGTKIIFSIGETLPPAGTYRVSLNWKSEDTCYAQMQEIFFINYLAYTEYEETGGAEQ